MRVWPISWLFCISLVVAGCESAPIEITDHTETTAGCHTACDCEVGLACVEGMCKTGAQPVYCCGTSQCPSGASCETTGGLRQTCANTGPSPSPSLSPSPSPNPNDPFGGLLGGLLGDGGIGNLFGDGGFGNPFGDGGLPGFGDGGLPGFGDGGLPGFGDGGLTLPDLGP